MQVALEALLALRFIIVGEELALCLLQQDGVRLDKVPNEAAVISPLGGVAPLTNELYLSTAGDVT